MEIIENFFDELVTNKLNHHPHAKQNIPHEYVYRCSDRTECSASYAMSDIYDNKSTGKYLVVTEVGSATRTGDDPKSNSKTFEKYCDNLAEVFDELLNYCFHDPNTGGELFMMISNAYDCYSYECHEYKSNKEKPFLSWGEFVTWYDQQSQNSKDEFNERLSRYKEFRNSRLYPTCSKS
jgi:hypothetical protein